jgi:hypothetical protein
MKTTSLNRSAGFHCLVSAVAVCGSFAGWNLWFVSGGWERHQHWGEGTLWAASAIIGLWAAVDAIRLARARGSEGIIVTMCGLLLAGFHFLSLLFLRMFVYMLAEGGPRP